MPQFVIWEAKGELRDSNGEARKYFGKRSGVVRNDGMKYARVFRQYRELAEANHVEIKFY